ncbi:aspartic peptidase domain-containing protein [Schizothecium vesticola]|uniref:Aspartic peptidase domain-containing protein n=1 Tax=Schizothecium vesticola TaxID=314040 RepID=A0AA40FCD7_9PEZI|nr:aspartic peptidase domain-containing protein [Schizothecium vesticola]
MTAIVHLVLAVWASSVLGQECGPVAFPITDVRTDLAAANSFMRGIPAKIGTPPQDIVMLPWAELNNTYIYDEQSDCDPSIIFNEQICKVRRGGYFIETDSTSFSKTSDLISAGGASQEITTTGTEIGVKRLISTSLAGRDRLDVGSGFVNIPLGIPRLRWDNGYTTLHALGLGSNSTYLNALVQAGQIPSRVWSLFWGRMWTDFDAMDGSLVLGGYDREKVIGRNFTQPLDYSEETGCWTGMKVTVNSLLVNFRNGSDFSIMPRNSAVQCCIVPQRQLLWEAPSGIVDAFEAATQMKNIGFSFGLHWSARLYNSSFFDGELSFLLSNGLQVRVPNSQFLTPFVDVARNGSRVVDRSKRELLMNGLADQPATLGRYFFTSAYLMVDHDAKTFTMWQANPSVKSSLVAVSKGGCGGTAGGTGTAANPPSTGTGSSSQETPSNTGAIAGGVVGGVAVLAIIAAVFLIRRRRNRDPPVSTEGASDSPEVYHKPQYLPPQEIHGTNMYHHGGKPVELRADNELQPPQYIHSGKRDSRRTVHELDGGRF